MTAGGHEGVLCMVLRLAWSGSLAGSLAVWAAAFVDTIPPFSAHPCTSLRCEPTAAGRAGSPSYNIDGR